VAAGTSSDPEGCGSSVELFIIEGPVLSLPLIKGRPEQIVAQPVRRGLRQPTRHAHTGPLGGITHSRTKLRLHGYRKTINLHTYQRNAHGCMHEVGSMRGCTRHGVGSRAIVAGTLDPAAGTLDHRPAGPSASRLRRLPGEPGPALPDADTLELGFVAGGNSSGGTASTGLDVAARGGLRRVDGRLVPSPFGQPRRAVPFASGTRTLGAMTWGDLVTAYRSTGIGNITMYGNAVVRAVRYVLAGTGPAGPITPGAHAPATALGPDFVRELDGVTVTQPAG
jgi:hypothetical protein